MPVGVSRCLASVVFFFFFFFFFFLVFFFFFFFFLNAWLDADQRCDSARSLFIILMIR